MCTAATYKTKDFYFGRTLDNGFSYGDEVTVMPRNYPLRFLEMGQRKTHYAMIGMACAVESYPLYYDAVNEKGVGMAGLNFVGNAVYRKREEGKDNIAQFELIPWILCQCAAVEEARALVEKMNLLDVSFNGALPVAQLHWMIADKEKCGGNMTIMEYKAETVRKKTAIHTREKRMYVSSLPSSLCRPPRFR